jgi:hypothetical protein
LTDGQLSPTRKHVSSPSGVSQPSMRLKVASESWPLSGFEQSLSHRELGRHWEIYHVLVEYRSDLLCVRWTKKALAAD